ncbi:MAG: NAD(+)/NADH kinase [Acidobacteria bacterium]|nr:MAG: NAD(+)/NADH kinase [Acidobacteriota bacterium]
MAEQTIKRVGVVARSTNREAIRTALELADWLERRRIEVALDETSLRTREGDGGSAFRPQEAYDLVIVLGGDGTLLAVGRSLEHEVPILGVNLGTLGFLTELPRADLYPSLVKVLAGSFRIEQRSLFDVVLRRTGGNVSTFRAFNDAVITKAALSHIITLSVWVQGDLVARLRCDGLIVSTPSGSTAYNLSAGGPILSPDLPAALLTPICAHTLTLRPIVVPDGGPIEVVLETQGEEVYLTVDGQEGNHVSYRDRVIVRRSSSSVNLVRITGRGFYESLREKLKWGG